LPGSPNPVFFFALLVLGYRSCLHRRVILSHSRAPSTPPAGQTEKESEKAAQTKPDDFGENERDGLQQIQNSNRGRILIDASVDNDSSRGIVRHETYLAKEKREPHYSRLRPLAMALVLKLRLFANENMALRFAVLPKAGLRRKVLFSVSGYS
jgi:hypothetical protein